MVKTKIVMDMTMKDKLAYNPKKLNPSVDGNSIEKFGRSIKI